MQKATNSACVNKAQFGRLCSLLENPKYPSKAILGWLAATAASDLRETRIMISDKAEGQLWEMRSLLLSAYTDFNYRLIPHKKNLS